jgi:hypothetical protein
VIAWRLRRRTPKLPRAEARERTRVRSTVANTYDQVARMLAKAGFARSPNHTPREHAAQMSARGDPAAVHVGELTELYYAAEWGGQRDAAQETKAAALAVAVRTALDEFRKRRKRAG